MILARCHAGCPQPAVLAALRSLGAWGPEVSDQETLARLQAKRHGSYYVAKCPSHDDHNPSLSLKIGAGRHEAEMPWGNPVAIYPYHDERGVLLYEFVRHERYVNGRREKKLRPRLPGASRNGIADARRVIYRLPEVVANQIIFVPEGERDVETLAAWVRRYNQSVWRGQMARRIL